MKKLFLFGNKYTAASCLSFLYFFSTSLFLLLLQEKFVELFSKDAYDSAVEDRKSFVAYKHLGKTSLLSIVEYSVVAINL